MLYEKRRPWYRSDRDKQSFDERERRDLARATDRPSWAGETGGAARDQRSKIKDQRLKVKDQR